MAGGGPSDASTATARPDATGVGPLAIEHVTPSARASSVGWIRPRPRSASDRPCGRRPRSPRSTVPASSRTGPLGPGWPARARPASWPSSAPSTGWRATRTATAAGTPRSPDTTTGRPSRGIAISRRTARGDEVCSGVCAYWEADTALTGLALLTYLGAGYTHLQGRYTETVDRGLTFLIRQQKADGDLRGASVVVGMYCHAMATLALCEGYALTGDVRLRDPARAGGRLPGPVAGPRPAGLALQAGREHRRHQYPRLGGDEPEVGEGGRLPDPEEASVRRGVLAWLDRVASGQDGGLACYQPGESVTATMTAEAWVCRQFLGVGGPGPASTEAAEFLLRNESDRGQDQLLLLVLRDAGPVSARRRTLDALECRDAGSDRPPPA